MKKFLSFTAALLCVMSFGLIMASCGCMDPKAVEIDIKDGTLDTELFVGESLNLDNVVLVVTYENDEVEEVAKNDEMQFSNVDTSSAGQKTLTISYLELTTQITITVVQPTATNIAVKAGTLPSGVTQGLDLDTSNLVLLVTYDDGNTIEVGYNADMQLSGLDTEEIGEQTLTISYLGVSTTVQIDVWAPVETALSLKEDTLVTEVYQGKTLDYSTVVLIVYYNNNTTREIPYNQHMSFSGVDTQVAGKQTLTISYVGLETEVEINVIELEEVSISLVAGTLDTDLEADETLDTSGVKLLVTYNSGDQVEVGVSDGITFSNVDTSTPGAKQLTIYYKDLSISVPVTVANPVAVSIEVKAGTLDTQVTQGLTLDTSGVVLVVTYNTDDKVEVSDTNQMQFSSLDTSTTGKKTLTITYLDLKVNVEIEVIAPVVTRISVKENTLNTQVYQNDELNYNDIVLILHYNNNTQTEVTYNNQMQFSGVNTQNPGQQTLKIEYLGFETEVNINVIELKVESITLVEGTLAIQVFVGATLNTDGVKVMAKYNNGDEVEVVVSQGITFSNFDSSQAGLKPLTITYSGVSTQVQINVVEPKPTQIELVEGTLETVVTIGSSLNLDNVQLRVTYEDESVKVISKNHDMQFSQINTESEGLQTLTITYFGVILDIDINVIKSYVVSSYETPEFVTSFETNAQRFNIKTNTYKVGDDNQFVFKPHIVGYLANSETLIPEVIDDYVPSTFKVEQKVDGTYQELQGDALSNIVEIDELNYAFDFSAQAVGNTYRITISENSGVGSAIIEFEVIDGYNIQSKAELSVIDNNAKTQSAWSELKTQNNIPYVNPDAVVIHGTYELTDEDVPSEYYYYKGDNDLGDRLDDVVGTLRNWKSIYSHDTPSGSTFTIYGNYNTIDAGAIAITMCDLITANTSDKQSSGHSALFAFGGDNNNNPGTAQGNVVVDSLNLIGNANRSENPLLKGGLLMVLTNSQDTLIKNVVASSWVTNMVAHTHANGQDNSTHIVDCNFTDSFSNMLYYYGIRNNYIEDSSLVGSGGPLFTLTHVDPQEDNSRWSDIEIKNSHLETWINGTEAWFQVNNATAAASQLLALSQVFELTSQGAMGAGIPLTSAKTFRVQTDGVYRTNFIGMIISNGDNPIESQYPLKGKIVFKDADDQVTYTYDMESEGLDTIVANSTSISPLAIGSPYFMAGNVYATVVGTDIEHITGIGENPITPFLQEGTPPTQETIQKVMNFFSGDYLGVYLSGLPHLGALVGYYDMQ